MKNFYTLVNIYFTLTSSLYFDILTLKLTVKKKKARQDDFSCFKAHHCKIPVHDYWLNSFHFPLLQELPQKMKKLVGLISSG